MSDRIGIFTGSLFGGSRPAVTLSQRATLQKNAADKGEPFTFSKLFLTCDKADRGRLCELAREHGERLLAAEFQRQGGWTK